MLHEADIEVPQPGPGQVQVGEGRRAERAGRQDPRRDDGGPSSTTFPAVPGGELTSVVDALGEGVSDVQVGDEVLGWSDTGSYAQYTLATTVAESPPASTGSTRSRCRWPAAERVLDLLGVAAGETVLMHGASGAVGGSLAVQLATARGARVVATAGPANQDYLTSLGATATVYGKGLVERVQALAPDGVDAVFDLSGREPWRTPSPCGAAPTASSPSPTSGCTWTGASPSPQYRNARPPAWPPWLGAPRGRQARHHRHHLPLDQAATAQQVSDAGHVRAASS